MNPIFPIDTFTVVNKTILNNDDRKILNLLYQPILGSNPINLYMTLWSYLDKFEITSNILTHHDLMNNLQIKLETIIESLQKLEAIGLIKSYLKKGEINNYIYELYSPALPYDFFNDPILSTLLNNNVGDSEYSKLQKMFEVPQLDLEGYINVTANFGDVFEITDIVINNKDIKKRETNDINFDSKLDMNQVLTSIPNGMLDYRTVNKNVKEVIYKLAFIYNYDDKMISELIISSLENKKINLERLQQQCRDYYRFDNDFRLPSIIYKNQPEYLKTRLTSTSKKDKIIHMFDSMSPYEFITNKNKCKPTSNELDIIKYLLVDMKLNPGVVNVLIDYVLRINDNKLPKKYVTTIAAQWKRNNIETVEDAINISKEHNKIKKTTVKKEELPTWFNQDVEKEELSKEELEKLKMELGDLM